MINNIFMIMNIKVSKNINSFLYLLKKIPLIKKLVKDKDYSSFNIKKFISGFSLLYSLVMGPIKFALVFFLAFYIPSNGFGKSEVLNSILFFIFVFYFLAEILGSNLMEPNKEKFIIVKQMKMDPKVYAVSQITLDKVIEIFSKSMVLSLVFKYLFKENMLIGIQISLSIVMFSIFMEAFHLFIYKKTKFIINKFKKTMIGLVFLGIIVTYAIIAFTTIADTLNIFDILTAPIMTITLIILGVVSYIYLLNYDNYWNVISKENNIFTFKELEADIKDINFVGVKLKDSDYNEKSLIENDKLDKEGYDYLNHIFFKRHKRIVYKPMIIKSLVIFFAFIVLFVVDKFFVKGFGVTTSNKIIDTYTILFFFIYIVCNSSTTIKAFFYSCDRSLLRYGFYKKGDSLLSMFYVRFKRILLINMLPILLLCIGLICLVYFNTPDRIMELIPMLVSTLLLGILFSVHYIFMYYIIQPFTTGLEIKSPLYGIVNYLVYFISYRLMMSEFSAITILPYLLLFSIFYITFAMIMVYKKAPKTFKVK